MRDFTIKRRGGFTLVELLVVIATIAVLTAIGGTAYSSLIARANATKCMSNLRQIGIASLNYGAEHNGKLPESSHTRNSWIASLGLYADGGLNLACPEDRESDVSYAINDLLVPKAKVANPFFGGSATPSGPDYNRAVNIREPSRTMLFAERAGSADHFHFSDSSMSFETDVAVERHQHSAHYLFVDGHVESLRWQSVQSRLRDPDDSFIDPSKSHSE